MDIKMEDVEIDTCQTTGVSELYWHGGRVCIDLGNDINKDTATEIFKCIKNHDKLVDIVTEKNKSLKRIHNRCEFSINKLLNHNDICSHDREMMRQLLSYIKAKVDEE